MGFEPEILLLQPPAFWDYRLVLPSLAISFRGVCEENFIHHRMPGSVSSVARQHNLSAKYANYCVKLLASIKHMLVLKLRHIWKWDMIHSLLLGWQADLRVTGE